MSGLSRSGPRRAGAPGLRMALLSDGRSPHTRRWARYFAEQGDELLLLSLEAIVDSPVAAQPLGPRLRPAALATTLALPAARRALARFAPDLINAHFVPNYGWMAWLLGARPWVLSTWGSDVLVNPTRSPLHRWRARRVLRAADLVTSDADMLTAAIQALAGPGLPVITAPMGIDRALYESAAAAATAPRERIILHNRNLEPIYDLPTVLRGMPSLLAAHPGWSLRLAGEGSQRAALERLAASLGLEGRVVFLGRLGRAELMAELQRAAIYLSASRSDSTSVSLLEAMATGAYPVLSDLAANREWVAGPPAAQYFPVGHADALAAALARAIALPAAELAAARAANRATVAARAIWEENMAGLRERFLALAAAAGRGKGGER